MPRNIMAALNATPSGGAPQHGFDLSAFSDFHQKGGQFNVVGVRDTVPNSTYRMGVDGFTRSILCNTANFSHIKENYYFIHVPLALLCRNAYQMLVNRKQAYSALDMDITSFPVFPLATVVNRLIEVTQLNVETIEYRKWQDVHGFNMAYGAIKLLDMLGYGYFGDLVAAVDSEVLTVDQAKAFVTASVGTKKPTANRIAAYQCCWYHFFRNDIYDNDVSAKCFNFDDVCYYDGVNTVNYDITEKRSVDDFIIDCLQMRYVPYKKDLFMGAMPGTQYGPVSSVHIDVTFGDLSASFTGNPVTPAGVFQGTPVNPSAEFVGTPVTPSGSVSSAFQGSNTTFTLDADVSTDQGKHKFVNANGTQVTVENITGFQAGDFYRKVGDLHSSEPVVGRNPLIPDQDLQANLMAESGTVTIDGSLVSNVHKHDVTGEAFGVPQGVVSSTFTGNQFTPQGSVSVNGYTPQGTITLGSITPTGTVNLVGTPTSASLFDVLSLVEAQAIQKWRQKSMLAGNKTADQFRAHHGVVPRHLIDHLPDFIGSVDNIINVTEITSQADTAANDGESNLGEIRGRGYGASDARSFTFKSDDYGILLLLHAIVPENTYDSYGIEKGNTMITYTDFFQTEYQNIGLEAVPRYLLSHTVNDTPSQGPTESGAEGGDHFTQNTGVIGYAPRYFAYKQYQSKVHGMFNSSRLRLVNYTPQPDVFGYADMQSFVLPRRDFASWFTLNGSGGALVTPFVMNLSKLYVNPRIFDSIFAIAADDEEASDTFFSHVNFYCHASMPMSVLGLPQF